MRLSLSLGLLLWAIGSTALFTTAWAQNPENPELEQGLRLLKERRYEEAKQALNRATQSQPNNAETWVGLGNAHLATQSHREAVAAFERALSLAPDAHAVRYNLSFALRKAGRVKDAAASYRIYLEHQPQDPDAWYGLAETLREAKDAEGAAAAYESYADRESRPDRQTWVEKARRQAAALRAYAGESSKPAPSTPAPTTGEPAKPSAAAAAAKPETKEGSAGPSSTEILSGQAREALRAGRFEAALEILAAIPERGRKDLHVAAAFAAAYLGSGDAERAIQWYRSALVVAPDTAKSALLLGLAEAYRRDGNTTGAREALKAVIDAEDEALKPLAVTRLDALNER